MDELPSKLFTNKNPVGHTFEFQKTPNYYYDEPNHSTISRQNKNKKTN